MNKSRFHPVVPNITDDSMISKTNAASVAEETARAREGRIHSDKSKKTGASETETETETAAAPEKTESAFGRKLIIGTLIVIIIVLLILLIYQIYKYYSLDEVPLDPSRPPENRGRGNQGDPPDPPRRSGGGSISSSSSSGRIPENVRSMDNDVLSQFVQKSGNKKEQRRTVDRKNESRPRVVEHKEVLSTIPEETESAEMDRIESIIDSARSSQVEVTDVDDKVPSRDDLLRQMQRDMSSEAARIDEVEDFSGDTDSILDTFAETSGVSNQDLLVDDSSSTCRYLLTKGPNSGSPCGRRATTGGRCTRHMGK